MSHFALEPNQRRQEEGHGEFANLDPSLPRDFSNPHLNSPAELSRFRTPQPKCKPRGPVLHEKAVQSPLVAQAEGDVYDRLQVLIHLLSTESLSKSAFGNSALTHA